MKLFRRSEISQTLHTKFISRQTVRTLCVLTFWISTSALENDEHFFKLSQIDFTLLTFGYVWWQQFIFNKTSARKNKITKLSSWNYLHKSFVEIFCRQPILAKRRVPTNTTTNFRIVKSKNENNMRKWRRVCLFDDNSAFCYQFDTTSKPCTPNSKIQKRSTSKEVSRFWTLQLRIRTEKLI